MKGKGIVKGGECANDFNVVLGLLQLALSFQLRLSDKPFKPLDVAKEMMSRPFWNNRWVRSSIIVVLVCASESVAVSEVFVFFDGRSRETRSRIRCQFPTEKTGQGHFPNTKELACLIPVRAMDSENCNTV